MACVLFVMTLSLANVWVVIFTTAVHGGVELVLCTSLTPSSDFRLFNSPFTVGVSVIPTQTP